MDALATISPVYRWIVTLAYVGVIIALSIAPGIEKPGDSVFSWLVVNTATPLQKIMHVAVYAALAAVWMWTLAPVESRATRIALTLAATLGLGAILEWHQTTVPGRFGTVTDVLLNLVGAIIGLLIAIFLL